MTSRDMTSRRLAHRPRCLPIGRVREKGSSDRSKRSSISTISSSSSPLHNHLTHSHRGCATSLPSLRTALPTLKRLLILTTLSSVACQRQRQRQVKLRCRALSSSSSLIPGTDTGTGMASRAVSRTPPRRACHPPTPLPTRRPATLHRLQGRTIHLLLSRHLPPPFPWSMSIERLLLELLPHSEEPRAVTALLLLLCHGRRRRRGPPRTSSSEGWTGRLSCR